MLATCKPYIDTAGGRDMDAFGISARLFVIAPRTQAAQSPDKPAHDGSHDPCEGGAHATQEP